MLGGKRKLFPAIATEKQDSRRKGPHLENRGKIHWSVVHTPGKNFCEWRK